MKRYTLLKKTQYPYNDANEPYEVSLVPGEYLIECVGASGGGKGGYGARVSAVLKLSTTKTFFIFVGSKGENIKYSTEKSKGGFNGGGKGGGSALHETKTYRSGAGGGGATDFRLYRGNWYDEESLKSRIIVAGGGGGEGFGIQGGSGGRLTGLPSEIRVFDDFTSQSIPGGKQEGDDNFGFGQDGIDGVYGNCCAEGKGGGGGGWYGGSASQETSNFSNAAGGGGSSYISGMPGCIDNQEIVFSYAIMESGQTTKHEGNGYASISRINPLISCRNYRNKNSHIFLLILLY